MPGSLYLESKISLARLAGDLMSKTYIVRKEDDESENILVEAVKKVHPIELQIQSSKTKTHEAEAEEEDQDKDEDEDETHTRLWFLKGTQANFGKGITLHHDPLCALRHAGVKNPEKLFVNPVPDNVLKQGETKELDTGPDAENETENRGTIENGENKTKKVSVTYPKYHGRPWPIGKEAALADEPAGLTLMSLFKRSLADVEGEFVLQAHIPRPLHYEVNGIGHKVHARLFFLVHNPLMSTRTQYYLARVGWIDVSPRPWRMHANEKETQQTHTRHSAFQEWSLYPKLYSKCCALLGEMAKRVHNKMSELIVIDRSNFELYGVDLMFDKDMNPWLLEANSGPVLKAPYLPFLRGLLQIVIPWATGQGFQSYYLTKKLAQQTLLLPTLQQGQAQGDEQSAQTSSGAENGEGAEFSDIPERMLWDQVADFPSPIDAEVTQQTNQQVGSTGFPIPGTVPTKYLTYKEHLEALYDQT